MFVSMQVIKLLFQYYLSDYTLSIIHLLSLRHINSATSKILPLPIYGIKSFILYFDFDMFVPILIPAVDLTDLLWSSVDFLTYL